MQEVFEKIVAEMKNKSMERFGNDGMGGEMVVNLDDAIEIVKQAEAEYNNENNWAEDCMQYGVECCLKEYFRRGYEAGKKENNNGWIPVSERLPEENVRVDVTIEEEHPEETDRKIYYTSESWRREGKWVIRKNPCHPKVIAWKYPTEPYQPENE